MAKTYPSKAKYRVVQPFFERFRQRYRGHRNSVDENREMNFFLIDVNKINNTLTSISTSIDDVEKNFIGNLNNLSSLEISEDGLFYDLSPIRVFYQDVYELNTPAEQSLYLSKANRLSAILARLETKVTRIENGR
jgi:hypothetical protein